MPRSQRGSQPKQADVYWHKEAHRLNNPEAGLAFYEMGDPPQIRLEHRVTTDESWDPRISPQLVWAGKSITEDVRVDAVSVHVHERISAEAIVRTVLKNQGIQLSMDLFADPK